MAEPAHPTFAAALPLLLERIGDEPIAELRIIAVHVDDDVGGVRVGPVTI